MLKTVIFSAPEGYGKTLNALALQREFGCSAVVDEWEPQQPLLPGVLHLTNLHPREMPGVASLPCSLVARGWNS